MEQIGHDGRVSTGEHGGIHSLWLFSSWANLRDRYREGVASRSLGRHQGKSFETIGKNALQPL